MIKKAYIFHKFSITCDEMVESRIVTAAKIFTRRRLTPDEMLRANNGPYAAREEYQTVTYLKEAGIYRVDISRVNPSAAGIIDQSSQIFYYNPEGDLTFRAEQRALGVRHVRKYSPDEGVFRSFFGRRSTIEELMSYLRENEARSEQSREISPKYLGPEAI